MRVRWFARLTAAAIAAAPACGPPPADLGDVVPRFQETARTLAANAEAEGRTTVPGLDDWLFFGPELRHVSVGPFWGPDAAAVSRARDPESADPLAAILDFRAQLRDLGVELIVMPVPAKSVIYPDQLAAELSELSAPPRLDPDHVVFYTLLRQQGVELLDLTERFLQVRNHPRGPLYCLRDTHWSGVGVAVASAQLAGALLSRSWYGAPPGDAPHIADWRSATINGDLEREAADGVTGETLQIRSIGIADGTDTRGAPPEPDPNSPVVLLGDSHNLVFHAGDDMHATDGGLPEQLAFELGFPVDVVAVRGSASTAARVNLLRRAQADPTYWERKRMVIWVFSVREFTEGDGWPLIPIRPDPPGDPG